MILFFFIFRRTIHPCVAHALFLVMNRYFTGGFLLVFYTYSDLFCALSWVYLNGFNGGVFINDVVCPTIVNLMSDQSADVFEHRGVVEREKARIIKEVEDEYFTRRLAGLSEKRLKKWKKVKTRLKKVEKWTWNQAEMDISKRRPNNTHKSKFNTFWQFSTLFLITMNLDFNSEDFFSFFHKKSSTPLSKPFSHTRFPTTPTYPCHVSQ